MNSQILLLLSKESMKCDGTKMEFLEDQVNILSKNISLHFTSSGYCTILLNDIFEGLASLDDCRFIEVYLTKDNLCNKSQTEKWK